MPRPIALVTGAAVRLGRAIAERLSLDGYDLLLHHRRDPDEALSEVRGACLEAGAQVLCVQADLSDPAAVSRLAGQALGWRGGVDLLVNSAAIFWPTRTLDHGLADWGQFQAVNVEAPMRLAAELSSALAERGGAIVNLVDIYSDFPLKGYLPYAVSKSGMAMLTRGLALELAPRVRVNGVSPGYILPPPGGMSPEHEERLLRRIPLGRHGRAEDIAGAVSFLAAAPYITGQILAVDGGRTLHP